MSCGYPEEQCSRWCDVIQFIIVKSKSKSSADIAQREYDSLEDVETEHERET